MQVSQLWEFMGISSPWNLFLMLCLAVVLGVGITHGKRIKFDLFLPQCMTIALVIEFTDQYHEVNLKSLV